MPELETNIFYYIRGRGHAPCSHTIPACGKPQTPACGLPDRKAQVRSGTDKDSPALCRHYYSGPECFVFHGFRSRGHAPFSQSPEIRRRSNKH